METGMVKPGAVWTQPVPESIVTYSALSRRDVFGRNG